MKNFNENRIENEQLLRCVKALEDKGIGVLKEVLRKQFTHEIEWAVWHRISIQDKGKVIPDNIRKSLRDQWGAMDCPICGNYMYYDISEECIVEVEHIIERGLGGSNELSNLVPCCNDCNRSLGNVFNEYVLQAKEKRQLSNQEWVRLIGDWVVFKQLLYWDRNLAFWLFENFHRQFNSHASKPIKWSKEARNFDGLIHRTKIAERFERVIKELNERNIRKQFEIQNGPSPKPKDMSAFARQYRLRLRQRIQEVH